MTAQIWPWADSPLSSDWQWLLDVSTSVTLAKGEDYLRMMSLLDEYTREALVKRVERRLGSMQVIETLADVMLVRGVPEFNRSDTDFTKIKQVQPYKTLSLDRSSRLGIEHQKIKT